ncbi:MAG: M20 metallopeptidase family protein [Thermoplasmatota archaeon]
MNDVVALRHELHRLAETSGNEAATSAHLQAWLSARGVDVVETGIGGEGFLAKVGEPNRLFRADLDALPLAEATGVSYAAENAHHACGHDGHMAMLAGALSKMAVDGGSAFGLFQPAEETGEGALACLADASVANLPVKHCFAIHNLPGLPLGAVSVADGTAAVASEGLRLDFTGASSHAAEPFAGRSPVAAVASLALFAQGLPNQVLPFDEGALATVVGMQSGGERYGTSPGEGQLFVTLRAGSDAAVQTLREGLVQHAKGLAEGCGLTLQWTQIEPFPATRNDSTAVALARDAAKRAGCEVIAPQTAPWSEDFGHFTSKWPGALVLLGAGVSQPALHAPTYDFPDALLERGVQFWWELAQ